MTGDITSLLGRWSAGDREALQALMPLVYPRLRSIAGSVFRGGHDGTTIQPTVLVHETYLRLLSQNSVDLADREHFYCFAAQCMRRILVSHFRARAAQKRGGVTAHLSLHAEVPWITMDSTQMLEVDQARISCGRLTSARCGWLSCGISWDARRMKLLSLRDCRKLP
ncbi:MAG TPA: ECF-type sigma factor [Bryobacteraceae bacterium]|jgi:RNA polymerase sigma factor (TIGR02999 family)|nr:ECF-type sigma factor [Bryobacteraceae bacterium]